MIPSHKQSSGHFEAERPWVQSMRISFCVCSIAERYHSEGDIFLLAPAPYMSQLIQEVLVLQVREVQQGDIYLNLHFGPILFDLDHTHWPVS